MANTIEIITELLQKAARCYVAAGWEEDACRCFEAIRDTRSAAIYHERLGRYEEAARYYQFSSEWGNAARCFLESRLFEEAAECMLKAGDLLQAAWLLADEVHLFKRARSVAGRVKPKNNWELLAVELIFARCNTGENALSEAAKTLYGVIAKLGDIIEDKNRLLLSQWAFKIVEFLHRPDLISLIHAANVSSGISQADKQWELWALSELGNATGVPVSDEK